MEPCKTVNEEELAKKIENAQDMDELLSTLKEAGVETTQEDLLARFGNPDDELSDDSLEGVTGGWTFMVGPLVIFTLYKVVKKLIKVRRIP